jgi:O-antigen ligase
MAVTADNGFYDLALGLGLIGFGLFCITFLWSLRMAIQQCMASRSRVSLWPVAYLSFFLIHNMSESTLLTRGTLPFLLFGAISTSLALQQRQRASVQVSLDRRSLPELAVSRLLVLRSGGNGRC